MKANTPPPKTLADVTEIIGEDSYIADFRKQAEKHFKRRDVMVINHGDGQLEAVVVGAQALAPQPSKADKLPTQPQKPAEQPVRGPHIPKLPVRLHGYARAYAFDALHGTQELAYYRQAIRKAKQQRLRDDLGLTQP